MLWTIHKFDSPRYDAATCAVGTKIFAFGIDTTRHSRDPIDMHVLDTVKLKWFKLNLHKDQDRNCFPFRRFGFTVVAHDSKIYLWGGHSDTRTCNTLFCFDTGTLKWSTPKVFGQKPLSRYGHTACIIGNGMYIFGGDYGLRRRPIYYGHGLFRLDLGSMSWHQVQTNGVTPLFKDFHTATAIDNRMYIYGEPRRSDHLGKCSKLVYLDTVTNKWVYPYVNEHERKGRRGHCAFEHNGFLYIYGGFSRKFNSDILDLYLEEIDRYDPVTSTWITISPKGKAPCRRSIQTCQVINDKVFVCGGIFPASPVLELFGTPQRFDHNELIFNPISPLRELHVLDLNPSLKDLCLVIVADLLRENRTKIADLSIPLTLKDDLANFNPSRDVNEKKRKHPDTFYCGIGLFE